MTKAEIVQALYTRVGGFSKKESADIVDIVFEMLKETLGRGEKIKISGFGNFVLRDKLALMRRIWADDEAEFEGTYARLPASWSWPKPSRPGGPPVLLGIKGELRNYERIAAWCDGWIPMAPAFRDEEFVVALAELRRTWAEAGRDPDTLDITVLQPPGPADDLRRALDRADQLGVRRVLLTIDEARMADAEALLDQAGAVIPGR